MNKSQLQIKPIIGITNVVSTCELEQKIDIASFNKYEFLCSDLEKYQCGYIKDNSMRGKVTVFGNGKMISVGRKNVLGSFNELNKAVQILKKHKLARSKRIVPKVRNIVALLSTGMKIDIEKMARSIPRSIYEPETFAGVITRLPHIATCLVFSSGKIVITGANSESRLDEAVFEIIHRLEKLELISNE